VAKKAIIVDGYVYRHGNTLKNGDVVYVCSRNKKCNKSITTDPKGGAVVKTTHGIHTCIILTCIQVYLDHGNGIYFFYQ
jgi:hypothetical protein